MRYAIAILALTLCLSLINCDDTPEVLTTVAGEDPVVLEEGSTSKDSEYFVDETGRVIYTETREIIPGDELTQEEPRDPSLPPIFSGAQRIYPTGEDPEFRESYITRASFELVEHCYSTYLETGTFDRDEESSEPKAILNAITSTDPDGRKQSALFVNYDNVPEGTPQPNPRAGMKVLIKEYPDQHAVQIVLTTLQETPLGFNPVGVWITPEEAEILADEAEERQEQQRLLEEALSEQSGNEDDVDVEEEVEASGE